MSGQNRNGRNNKKKATKIFVAAPFTGKLSDKKGCVSPGFKQELLSLYQSLRKQGYEVISAHEREQWGEKLMAAEVCTPLDLAGIRECDLLVVIPGNPPSGGVHIEIGYATAKRKPIIQIRQNADTYTPLLNGICTETETTWLSFRHSISEVLPKVNTAIKALLS